VSRCTPAVCARSHRPRPSGSPGGPGPAPLPPGSPATGGPPEGAEGTATLLCTDVEGSARRWERRDGLRPRCGARRRLLAARRAE